MCTTDHDQLSVTKIMELTDQALGGMTAALAKDYELLLLRLITSGFNVFPLASDNNPHDPRAAKRLRTTVKLGDKSMFVEISKDIQFYIKIGGERIGVPEAVFWNHVFPPANFQPTQPVKTRQARSIPWCSIDIDKPNCASDAYNKAVCGQGGTSEHIHKLGLGLNTVLRALSRIDVSIASKGIYIPTDDQRFIVKFNKHLLTELQFCMWITAGGTVAYGFEVSTGVGTALLTMDEHQWYDVLLKQFMEHVDWNGPVITRAQLFDF